MDNDHRLASDAHDIDDASDAAVERVVAAGPRGAVVVAGIATLIVVAIWIAFYVFVFLPRGVIH